MKKIIVCFLLILNFMYAEEDVRQSFAAYVNKEDSLALDTGWYDTATFKVSILNQGIYKNDFARHICVLMNEEKYREIFDTNEEVLILVRDLIYKKVLGTYNCKKF